MANGSVSGLALVNSVALGIAASQALADARANVVARGGLHVHPSRFET